VVDVQPLDASELDAADRVMRLAFGSFLGLPDPSKALGDTDYVRTRWRADPSAAFGAHIDGRLVGSNFAANWGSVGFVGPLTTHPEVWDRHVGSRLMEPVMSCFDRWGTHLAGLFTFAHSPKHIGLYQKFGFWPRFLTAIMTKTIGAPAVAGVPVATTLFSEVPVLERDSTLDELRRLTDGIFAGLDLSSEVRAVAEQRLGDTVIARDDAGALAGFAICHCGAGTEAGSGVCYVKFAAARSAADFSTTLDAAEAFAAGRQAARILAGMNAGRPEAYRLLADRGFQVVRQGVAMQRPNEPGYNRAGVFVIDDWR